MTMMTGGRWLWLLLLCSVTVNGSSESSTCSAEDGTCRNDPCTDKHEDCDSWASTGECEKNPDYMLKHCLKSCMVCVINGTQELDLGVKQRVPKTMKGSIQRRLEDAESYIRNVVAKDYRQRKLIEICKNKKRDCAQWAVQGECENNPEYMKSTCAPVCHSCQYLSMSMRCPIDLDKYPNAWEPGDLNRFFTNVTTLEKYKQYTPTVLSRPDYLPGDTDETAEYKIGPWIVSLDNVLTDEEMERLIELGYEEGYEASYAGGKVNADGTYERAKSESRTSYNSWCQDECYEDELAQQVMDRIADITNIPETHSEYLQLLKYEVGQFYKTHSDYLEHGLDRQTGVRLLTVFMYLSDVEEGGGTEFPKFNITVQPKRGKALIWPSVLDEDPDKKDFRTEHQALPVIAGTKYAANAWIHRRNFKDPFNNGCN